MSHAANFGIRVEATWLRVRFFRHNWNSTPDPSQYKWLNSDPFPLRGAVVDHLWLKNANFCWSRLLYSGSCTVHSAHLWCAESDFSPPTPLLCFKKLTPAPGVTPDYRKFIDSCSCLAPVTNRVECKLQIDNIISLTLWLNITPAPTIENIHSYSCSGSCWKTPTPPESTPVLWILHTFGAYLCKSVPESIPTLVVHLWSRVLLFGHWMHPKSFFTRPI